MLAAAPVALLASSPAAFALYRDDGDQPGPSQPIGLSLLVFVGGPLLLFAILGLLVYAPALRGGPRYRPGLSWWAAPVWFGGPVDAESAVAAASGARSGGGASARW